MEGWVVAGANKMRRQEKEWQAVAVGGAPLVVSSRNKKQQQQQHKGEEDDGIFAIPSFASSSIVSSFSHIGSQRQETLNEKLAAAAAAYGLYNFGAASE